MTPLKLTLGRFIKRARFARPEATNKWHTGESKRGEDIDEFVFKERGVTVHIEKMANNEYFIGIDAGEKTATLFIGLWTKKRNLLLNIADNDHGKWHY